MRDLRGRVSGMFGLSAIMVLVAVLLALPIVTVAIHVFLPGQGTWSHLADTVLWQYIWNTVWLGVGTGIGVTVVGITTAWLVAMCRFPGRGVFQWALMLPLAVPAYVLAYTYTDFLQVAGPVQSMIRDLTGWTPHEYWFPNIRSLEGAIVLFVVVLYPYVYLLCRTAFLEQSVCVQEASRTLGCGPWRSFSRVALPLARPAIAGGTALALMETLADFGTVSFFGLPTFTTGIYRAWFSLGDRVAAAQLSTVLLGFVLVLVVMERWSRGGARYHHTTGRYKRLPSYRLRGWRAGVAVTLCSIPLVLGFLLPAAILVNMAFIDGDAQLGSRYLELAWNSVSAAGLVAVLAVVLAVFLAYSVRLRPTALSVGTSRVASLGYAVPGSVIAVGILIPLSLFDNALDQWTRTTFGFSTGLLLTGSIVGLVYAYLVRFLAVSMNTVDASLAKITPSMDGVARTLGLGPFRTLLRVHMPIMWGGLCTAGLIVFVDVMKELPATLLLRPFNFDTLAVQAYNLAIDERLTEAATPSLAIVAAGLIPVVLLSRAISRARPGQSGAAAAD